MSTKTTYENGRLTVARVYDAPREEVFEAWIETAKVEKWWGCADTTKVKSEVEPRVGGKYCHLMTIREVGDYPMNAVITEYDPPALLAYELEGMAPGQTMTVRVVFTEIGDQTEVRLTHDNLPTEMGDMVSAGWTASFGKLDRFLIDEAAAA